MYLNDWMPVHMKRLVVDVLQKKGVKLKDVEVAILIVALLEDINDTHNTPAELLYCLLKSKCKSLIAHDPYVKNYENLEIVSDLGIVINGRDYIIVETRHREYLQLKPENPK
jgi:UDP-N-acetyl-D-mannosaminuronate dehydrogenase